MSTSVAVRGAEAAETEEGRTTRWSGPRNLRVLIFVACLASSAYSQGIVPLLPAYAHRFALNGFETGMLLASSALSTLAVSLPAGALSDRLGARRLTVASGVMMAVAMVLQGAAPSFSVLLLSRLVFGAGYGIVWTAGLAWLAGASSSASDLGGTVACSGVGGILGPLLTGSLAGLIGLAAPFYLAALALACLTALLVVLRLPAPEPRPAAPAVRHSMGRMMRNRGIAAATAAVVVSGLSWSVCYLLGPQELHAAAVSTATIGFVLSAAATVFVIGSVATISLGESAVRVRWILLAIAATAFAFAPAIVSSAPMVVTGAICASAVARSVLWTVCYPLAARGAERVGIGTGVVMGFLQAVSSAVTVVFPLAAGAAVGVEGPRGVFALALFMCLGLLAATMAWIYRHLLGARLRTVTGRAV